LTLLLILSLGGVAEAASTPDWTLRDTGGQSVRFSEALKKGPVLVSFWALWCAPCLKELPHIDAIAEDFEAEITVFAVNADTQRSVARVRPYLRSKGYEVTVPLDTAGELARKLQIGNSIPFTVLYDADGREFYRHTGYKEGDEHELRAQIEALLAREPGR
jgi:thiol-disulfide isomerase/thioredoxin